MHGDFFGNPRPPEPPSWITLVRAATATPVIVIGAMIAGSDGLDLFARWAEGFGRWIERNTTRRNEK